MSTMTKLACNAMVDFVFGNGNGLKSPTSLHLALFTNDPAEDTPIEVPTSSAYGYSRQIIKFSPAKDGRSYNTETITFPAAKRQTTASVTIPRRRERSGNRHRGSSAPPSSGSRIQTISIVTSR